jgi:hypothetical protein
LELNNDNRSLGKELEGLWQKVIQRRRQCRENSRGISERNREAAVADVTDDRMVKSLASE